jgi:hypothetical protein
LPQKIGNSFDHVGRQCRFEQHYIGGEFLGGRKRLGKRFSLTDDANVIFHRKDLAQASAKDGLRVGHDHTNELTVAFIRRWLPDLFFRSNWTAGHQVLFV